MIHLHKFLLKKYNFFLVIFLIYKLDFAFIATNLVIVEVLILKTSPIPTYWICWGRFLIIHFLLFLCLICPMD